MTSSYSNGSATAKSGAMISSIIRYLIGTTVAAQGFDIEYLKHVEAFQMY